jgi:hypothetical protein
VQSAQGDVARFLFDGSTFRLAGKLLRRARVAKPDGHVVNRMNVIQAAFAGLEGDPQNVQAVIFQDKLVVGLLHDGDGCRRFLRGEECKDHERRRDVEPGFHDGILSLRMAAGRFYWLDKSPPMDFCARRRSWRPAEKQEERSPRGQNLHSRLIWKRRPG